jgi:hypothetical protein
MKIKLLVSLATERRGYAPGDVVEWPDADAARLITAGYAESAEPEPKPATPAPNKK